MHIRNCQQDRQCELEEARQVYIEEVHLDIQHFQDEINNTWPDFAIQIIDHVVSAPALRRAVSGSKLLGGSPAIDDIDEIALIRELNL